MENSVIETSYPLTFRKDDAASLGAHLKNRHSVVLIGMKRVGISNFLRFFLNHKEIVTTYISDGNSHLFIPVDLNDLVERELFPFWILTLKRILDVAERSSMANSAKKYVENLYVVIKVIDQEVKALLAGQKTPEEFISAFSERPDVEEKRKEARAVLGVEHNVIDIGVINAKYKDLAKKNHPDMPGGDTERFKEINSAHQILKRELL